MFEKKKAGLLSVIAFVVGSQIGIGVFMLVSSIVKYGTISVIGFFIGGIFAICLALVFSWLVRNVPESKGIHNYIQVGFGKNVAFYAGLMYWIVMIISNIATIITFANHFCFICNIHDRQTHFLVQICITSIVGILNLLGTKSIEITEVIILVFKVIGLLIIPVMAIIRAVKSVNIEYPLEFITPNYNALHAIYKTTFLSIWGFMGIESVMSNIGRVKDPNKTIPKALSIGTISVILFYILNIFSTIYLVPKQVLATSLTPYSDAIKTLFTSGLVYYFLQICPLLLSFSNLNIVMFASANTAEILSEDKILPKILQKQNICGAPYISVFLTYIMSMLFLIFNKNADILNQIKIAIDVSIVGIVVIYSLCSLSMIKILIQKLQKDFAQKHLIYLIISLLSLSFCIVMLVSTKRVYLIYCLLFLLMCVPYYMYYNSKKRSNVY